MCHYYDFEYHGLKKISQETCIPELTIIVQCYVGTFISVLMFGLIAYAVCPNLRNIFYQNIIIAILLFAITLCMPDECVTVDHDLASAGRDGVASGINVRQIKLGKALTYRRQANIWKNTSLTIKGHN